MTYDVWRKWNENGKIQNEECVYSTDNLTDAKKYIKIYTNIFPEDIKYIEIYERGKRVK